MNSKAQGHMFWIMVAAITAIIAMLVIIVIFSDVFNPVNKNTSCGGALVKGVCKNSCDDQTEYKFEAKCEDDDKGNKQVCCVGV